MMAGSNIFTSGANAEWRLESLSGDSGESCGRPSKIPLRAMDSLVLGPLGVES